MAGTSVIPINIQQIVRGETVCIDYLIAFYALGINRVYIAIGLSICQSVATFCDDLTNSSDDFDNFLHAAFI